MQTAVNLHALFEVGEPPITRVSGVGNVEFRIASVSEEPRQIRNETAVRTPQSFVCVVPTTGAFIRRAFMQESTPSSLPSRESSREGCAAAHFQCESEFTELLTCFQLWSSCEVSRYGVDRMELTELKWDVGKQPKNKLSHASSAVDNKCRWLDTCQHQIFQ